MALPLNNSSRHPQRPLRRPARRPRPRQPLAEAAATAEQRLLNGPSEFFDFDTTAGSEPPIPDAPPAETHQKITLNGESLAYTTRAGYMPLRNATTGQSEAHIFYTCYSKDGVSDASSRPYRSSSAARLASRPRGRSSAAWVRSA